MAKILFVTNDAWFFVSHRLPIAAECRQRNHECVVVAREDDTVQSITDAGCEFDAWNIAPRGRSIVGEAKTFLMLARLIRKHKPDIVHLITIKPVLYGGLMSRLLGVKCCVYAISGLGAVFRSSSKKAKKIRIIIAPLYKFAIGHKNSVVVFQNPDDRKEFLNMFSNSRMESTVIRGSGVDLQQFPVTHEPSGTPMVLLAARLLKEKGISEFVKAAEQLLAEGVDARFVVAGGQLAQGNPGAYDEKELKELYANACVEFLGHRNDVPELIRQSAMVVLPSYAEGLPKVLVEAGAAMRPVVTTDIPGCRDAIVEGETGILVKVRDVTSLADAIRALLLDKQKRVAMGQAGRELVEREMAIEKVVAEHVTIFDRLLSN